MLAAAYLDRIGYQGSLEPSAATLCQLHRAHLLAVPFENLDIRLGRPIALSLPMFYDKIVRNRRGGFCYELNGLFGWLLEEVGFRVTMLSARVYEQGRFGAEFGHMVLMVDTGEYLIADVGFGDSFVEPLSLETQAGDQQPGCAYRLTGPESGKRLERRLESKWAPQYVFSLTPRRLDDFTAMCQHHQTSALSHFTRKSVCSLATQTGRITLSNNRLIAAVDGQQTEREVTAAVEYRALLRNRFGIDLDEAAHIERLMAPGKTPG